jgi:cytidyltransferase-like protein
VKIGLIAGSFKPFTKGHYNIIKKASSENEQVFVYASTSDRDFISFDKMSPVWEEYILPNLPSNVQVLFVRVPIKSVYDHIEIGSNSKEQEIVFSLYGDKVDLEKNFPSHRLKKVLECSQNVKRVKFRSFLRKNANNISATKMRDFLQKGDENAFLNGLPPPLKQYGNKVFNLLKHT